MAVSYTDSESVADVKVTEVPAHGQSATGYGSKIPTRHMINYLGTWRRVYVMAYSNSGTPYVNVKGENVILDVSTRNRLAELD